MIEGIQESFQKEREILYRKFEKELIFIIIVVGIFNTISNLYSMYK